MYSVYTAQRKMMFNIHFTANVIKYILVYIQQLWSRPEPSTFSPHYHLGESPLPGSG